MSRTGPIFIVAPPGDAHALVVAARIESRGYEAVIWDSARLPSTDQISLDMRRGGQETVILESTACGDIDLTGLRSIWWRRPTAPTIPSTVVNQYMRGYCRSEADQLFRGILAALKLPFYNDPDAEDKASRKAYQLSVASEVGLSLPNTLITSSPARALEFCRAFQDGVILKPFRTPAGSQCSTQEYGDSLSERLQLLRNAPVIFQEKVPPHMDVRVSVVGKRIFSGISCSKLLDWRVDGKLTWKAHKLPQDLESQVLLLLQKLELDLGQLDFRLTAGNEYIFFEVNPSGQFLFLEMDDHQIEITAALADLLIDAPGGDGCK